MIKKYLILIFIFQGIIAQNQNAADNRSLIIRFSDQSVKNLVLTLEKGLTGIKVIDSLGIANDIIRIVPISKSNSAPAYLMEFNRDIDAIALSANYFETGFLVYAEPNGISYGGGQKSTLNTVTNDSFFNRQWGFVNDGSLTGVGNISADADVDMELAWDIETGDPDLIIAVPDSGLSMTHPDIASRIWINEGEIPDNEIDDDGNGFVDDVNGWDWVNDDNLPMDDLGHGTNICGIIGAIPNNNSLYAGVNWNSKIMPLKVLNSANTATYANLAAAIYYAVDMGAKIISFSIGGGQAMILADAVDYANEHNVLIVVCMMNFDSAVPYFPAGLSLTRSNVIAVGSTNPDDSRTSPFFWSATSGSSFGPHINVVAPGNYIYGLDNNSNTSPNSYWGGTSQATPLVAGIASLLLSADPSLTPAQIRQIIENSAEDQVGNPDEDVAGFDNFMGYGRVNAFAALQTLGVPDILKSEQEFSIINPVDSPNLVVRSNGVHPGNYTYSVLSMSGQKLDSGFIEIAKGFFSIPFAYSAGNYIVTLKSKSYSKVLRVVCK